MLTKYKILSHTADLRLEVYGKTLEELFMNAAEALARILHERSESTKFSVPPEAGHSLVEVIELRSPNISMLLVDFLNEILARSNINKMVYRVKNINILTSDIRPAGAGSPSAKDAQYVGYRMSKIESVNLGTLEVQKIGLEAEIIGAPVEKFDEDVKAVTYHEVNIKKEGDIWKTRLVFDI